VGVSPAGFGILPKQSFQVRDSRKLSESPAGETPTLPEKWLVERGYTNAPPQLEPAPAVQPKQ
jgi:hypothetical protein